MEGADLDESYTPPQKPSPPIRTTPPLHKESCPPLNAVPPPPPLPALPNGALLKPVSMDIIDPHHEKTDLKVFVVVIPKEG